MDEELLADMDTDEIMKKQVEQLEKEKKEMLEKLRMQEKKVFTYINDMCWLHSLSGMVAINKQ